MSLRLKLLIIILSTVLIPIIVFEFFTIQSFQKVIKEQNIKSFDFIANTQKKRIEMALEKYKASMKFITSSTNLSKELYLFNANADAITLQAINNIIKGGHSIDENIIDVLILNKNGKVITSTDKSQIKSGEVIRLSEPLIFDSETVGVVQVDFSTRPLIDIASDFDGLGSTGETIIAKRNQAGDAVIITPSRFDSSSNIQTVVDRQQSLAPITRALDKKEGIFFDTVDFRGAPVFSVTRYISDAELGLVIQANPSEISFLGLGLVQTSLSFLFIFIAIIFFSLFWFIQSINEPIQDLVIGADKMEKGDFSTRVSIKTHDEFGRMGRSFNTMASKIQEFYAVLEDKVKKRTVDLEEKTLEAESSKVSVLNLLQDLKIEKGKISEAKAKDEAILQGIGDGVFVIDKFGTIILFNQAATIISGFGESETLGKQYFNILRFVKEGHIEPYDEFIRKALEGQPTSMINSTILVKKDGHSVPVSNSAAPILDRSGQVEGVVVIFRDVTKERELEHLKDEFVSMASHELRTPMTAIKGFISMIFSGDYGPMNEGLKEPLRDVAASTERLIHLVNDLLNVARIESHRLKFVIKSCSLNLMVDDVVRNLKPLVSGQGLIVTHDIPTKIIVQVDVDKFKQILTNLIDNAIKFTLEGSVNISAKIEKDFAKIFIRDTGVGIPVSEQSKLFGKFQQLSLTMRGKPEGTGLGLYLSRELGRRLGGDIWLESSKSGEGSTFVLSIPLAQSETARRVAENIVAESNEHPNQKI